MVKELDKTVESLNGASTVGLEKLAKAELIKFYSRMVMSNKSRENTSITPDYLKSFQAENKQNAAQVLDAIKSGDYDLKKEE